MGAGVWTQTQVYLLSIAALIAAASAIWLFKPTRMLVTYLVRGFIAPAIESLRDWLKVIIREETADIRAQVFTNGGSSLADKVNRTNMRIGDLQGLIADTNRMVAALHDTTETPVTQSQPPDLQV